MIQGSLRQLWIWKDLFDAIDMMPRLASNMVTLEFVGFVASALHFGVNKINM